MSKRIGISGHTEQRIISGARVAFDWRTTSEVDATRDPTNRKAGQKMMRIALRQERMRNNHKDAA